MTTFKCMECGRRFRTVRAAERAANEGCPGCGGCDVDLDVGEGPRRPFPTDPRTCDDGPDNLPPTAA